MRRNAASPSTPATAPTVCSIDVRRSAHPHEPHDPHVVDFDCLEFEIDDVLCRRVEVQVWADGWAIAQFVSDLEGMTVEPDPANARFFEDIAVRLLAT